MSRTNQPRRAWTKEEDTYLREHIEIMPLADIAKELNRTTSSVQRYAYRQDIELQKQYKYDDKLICEVKKLASKATLTHQEIADLTGMSCSYVSQLNNHLLSRWVSIAD